MIFRPRPVSAVINLAVFFFFFFFFFPERRDCTEKWRERAQSKASEKKNSFQPTLGLGVSRAEGRISTRKLVLKHEN